MDNISESVDQDKGQSSHTPTHYLWLIVPANAQLPRLNENLDVELLTTALEERSKSTANLVAAFIRNAPSARPVEETALREAARASHAEVEALSTPLLD